jgi:hypothetical protein
MPPLPDLDALHEELDRQRQRFERQVRRRLAQALANDAGYARLRAITDEEWQEAQEEGEEVAA